MKQTKQITIAIDGPAGAGKSTVSRAVARNLGYSLVDTGAIYRCVALLARRNGIDWSDENGLAEVVSAMSVSFSFVGDTNKIRLNNEDVSESIRTPEVSRGASEVAKHPAVRAGLLEVQRNLAGKGGAVLEGRDIGTVVFPDAAVKIFLDASAEVRAQRRFEELNLNGLNASYEQIIEEIRDRDRRDTERNIAPLRAAEDAIIVDSSKLTPEMVVERIILAVRAALGNP